MFDIVTFGSAVIDTFVNTDVPEKNELISYPVGSKILIKDLRFDVGGGGTNTATAFARFGFKTGCICGVGEDNNGKDILDCLKKEKIKSLVKVKEGKSGYSIVLDSREHERTILTFKGPNNKIEIKDVKRFKTKWLYFSALLEESLETQKKIVEKYPNAKLAFNPSSYIIKEIDITSILKRTEVLILNKEEAQMLCKKYNRKGDLLKGINSLGPKIVVITDKDNPAVCFDGKQKYSIKPHKNIKVVERTGAGDAFASGFVAGMMKNYSIEKCLKLALREGESVLRHFGAKNNLIREKLK